MLSFCLSDATVGALLLLMLVKVFQTRMVLTRKLNLNTLVLAGICRSSKSDSTWFWWSLE